MQNKHFFVQGVIGLAMLLISGTVQAQSLCEESVERLYRELLKTASGKAQLKGAGRSSFVRLTDTVRQQVIKTENTLSCFFELTRMLEPLRDNHLHFYQSVEESIPADSLRSANWIKQYRKRSSFVNFPSWPGRLDSLEQELLFQQDSIQGIYYQGHYMKLAIFKAGASDSLTMVVTESKLPQWVPGQILGWLWPKGKGRFASVYANFMQKNWSFHRNVRFVNQNLPFWGLVRDSSKTDYSKIAIDQPKFEYRKLASNVDYLRLGSFSAYEANRKEAADFYNQVKDSLNSDFTVVDLRNNGGGAFKTSKPFLQLIKKRARNSNVFLLINYHTVSNAEQFVVRLMGTKNVTILGQASRGMLTYGNNEGTRKKIGPFTLYITDMKGSRRDLRFEDEGIIPDVQLNNQKDWLLQVLELIQ